ncbi:MAG: hypothetical protein WED07_07760 [Candidatus Freyarchaeum deiterrae]
MPKRKYKFEISDSETDRKVTLTLEGDIPPHLAASLVEALSKKFSSFEVESEVSSNSSSGDSSVSATYTDLDSLSLKEKVEIVLLKCFKHGWFTSNDVQEQYVNLFKEGLPLSTMSTYLARIYDESKESMLERTGTRKQYRYRLRTEKVKDRIEAVSQLDYLFT